MSKSDQYLKYRFGNDWQYEKYKDCSEKTYFNSLCKKEQLLSKKTAREIMVNTRIAPLHNEQEWSLHDEQKDADEPENYVIIKEEHNDWHNSCVSYTLKAI